MISREYCIMMARYNAWQNNQLLDIIKDVPEAELIRDRKAFFGSIQRTLNHLLWGDQLWMSRFDGGPAPEGGIEAAAGRTLTTAEWRADRVRTDKRISLWADQLKEGDLDGDLKWYAIIAEREMAMPMATCVIGVFNHQTHHRGQVHAMLTAAGSKAPVSDVVFLPETV